MKLGFLTACLPNQSLADIAAYASGAGYEALEVAAWPALGNRPFTATHLDVADFDEARADEALALFDQHRLTLSSLAFYDNNLHPDANARAAINDHVLACIDAAALLGCPTVGTFVGRDPSKPVAENLAEAERVFARWSMAKVAGDGEPDIPLIAHVDGISPAAGRRTTSEQDRLLDVMREAASHAPVV